MDILIKLVLYSGSIILIILLTRNIIALFSSVGDISTHKKRLKQLKFENEKTSSEEEKNKELIIKLTNPIVNNILPKLNLKNNGKLESLLKLSGWNKYFTVNQFIATDLILKTLSIVSFLIFFPKSPELATIWAIVLFFLFKVFLSSAATTRQNKLIGDFPTFIRIITGYLSSNKPLIQSIQNALPYIGKEWQPILRQFIVNCNGYSIDESIELLKQEIGIFEINQFWNLLQLNLKNGVNIKECFKNQEDKIKEMKKIVYLKEITKRQIMAVCVQGPLLLTILVAFGLPTFYSMVTLNVM